MAVLFGNEKHGLEADWVDLCQRKLTIPMAPEADSLNVAVAAGIFFHYFQRQAPVKS
jgi:tRNA G18 (ribose-2'-O)-methylase SpoU